MRVYHGYSDFVAIGSTTTRPVLMVDQRCISGLERAAELLIGGLLVTGASSGANALEDGSPSEAGSADTNWAAYGGVPTHQFFSPLGSVNERTIKQPGLAWFIGLSDERALEATPLAIDVMLYFSGTNGKAYAVDAETGKLIGAFDPQSGAYRPDIFRFSGSLCGHRGAVYWRSKVYVGVVNCRLFALDAKTGEANWSARTFDQQGGRETISGTPRVFNGKVMIGQTGDPDSRALYMYIRERARDTA